MRTVLITASISRRLCLLNRSQSGTQSQMPTGLDTEIPDRFFARMGRIRDRYMSALCDRYMSALCDRYMSALCDRYMSALCDRYMSALCEG